jgi:hypothetical protein
MVVPLTSSELRAPSCAITQHTVATSSKKRKAMPLALVARSPQAQTGFNQLQLPSARLRYAVRANGLSQKNGPADPPPPRGGPPVLGSGFLSAERGARRGCLARAIGPSGFRWSLPPTSPHQAIPKAM